MQSTPNSSVNRNPNHEKIVSRIVIGTLLASSLSGCFPLLVGGAVVGGSLVATDRRTSGSLVEDEGIELRASSRIRENLGERVHVNVTSYNRQVLLTGEVPNLQDKQLVEKLCPASTTCAIS